MRRDVDEAGDLGALDASARRAHDADPSSDSTDLALRRALLYVALPFWIVPGIADWYWHRRSRIEKTAGSHESLTHVLMMGSIGLPLTLALVCDINASVLASMMVATIFHEGVTSWDIRYAQSRRDVSAIEQQTHSFLEVMPFVMTALACCLKSEQFAALFGRGDEAARWRLEPKRPPLTSRYLVGLFGAVVLGIAVPYAEEFVRCFRVDRTIAPHVERADRDRE